MARKLETFGSYLRRFARTIDIVDENTFNEIKQLVTHYLQSELGAAYFTVGREERINGVTGLRTMWSSERDEHSTTIKSVDGSYSTQISVAFDRAAPLWIVSPNRAPLRNATKYVDLWSDLSDVLPPYRPPINRDLRTSIVLPLHRGGGRVLGVIYFESTQYLEFTEATKTELELVADALAILIDLSQANRVQSSATKDVLSELREILHAGRFPKLAKPQIFVASSSQADQQVMAVVKQVLNEVKDKLAVVMWSDIAKAGTITVHIVEEITKSRYGLCYFSEPANSGGKKRYQDNPNVIFEAGMLHSLTNSPVTVPEAWVPIREDDSPPAPFDFAAERIAIVPREQDGKLIREEFKDQLRLRLAALLQEDFPSEQPLVGGP
jgi:hypothetical protein